MFHAQLTAKGHIRRKQNVFLPQVNILIHYLIHIPLVENWRKLEKKKLGRWQPCKQVQHAKLPVQTSINIEVKITRRIIRHMHVQETDADDNADADADDAAAAADDNNGDDDDDDDDDAGGDIY